MEFAVKRFARNVLLLHLLLLLVVLALVLFASREIREASREQALQQAETRQRMLASQTSRGIEAFYRSILSDMDLMPRQDEDQFDRERAAKVFSEVTREVPLFIPIPANPLMKPPPLLAQPQPQPQSSPPRNPGGPPGGGGGDFQVQGRGPGRPGQNRGLLLGHLLGRQLEERVTHLFEVNFLRDAGEYRDAKNPKLVPVIRDEEHDVVVKPKPGEGPTPQDVLARYGDWLAEVARDYKSKPNDLRPQFISRFELFDGPAYKARGYNLVALPFGRGPTILVAAVPVATVTEQFLSVLNNDPSTTVLLMNDSQTVMAGSRPALAGVAMANSGDADLAAALTDFKSEGFKTSHRIDHGYDVAGEKFQASLLTAEPIDIAGRKWFIVVGSPLIEADAVVAQLFGRILVWAICVVVVITGILVSTSIQMIRGRVRLERVRSDSIRKELDRARQIQQAWLPRTAPACSTIDIAAANFPAHHISGDFYNWFELADGRIAVAIGDVTGHGMSAAFLMATTQLLVRTTMQRMTDPAACLAEVNRQLCTLVFNGQFVTIQIMVFDPDGGPVKISSAGHPAPLLADGNAFIPLAIDSQLVLGVDPEARYHTANVDLPEGASLLLYTDGAVDAMAPSGKRLGNEGLRAACPGKLLANRNKCGDAQALLDAVVSAVNHFRGSRELGDDLTFVSVRLTQPVRPVPTADLVEVG